LIKIKRFATLSFDNLTETFRKRFLIDNLIKKTFRSVFLLIKNVVKLFLIVKFGKSVRFSVITDTDHFGAIQKIIGLFGHLSDTQIYY
jgi:hypothetical protein